MFLEKTNLGCFPKKYYCNNSELQGRRKRIGGGGVEAPAPPPFPGGKNFFLRKIGIGKYSLFIEQDISNKK